MASDHRAWEADRPRSPGAPSAKQNTELPRKDTHSQGWGPGTSSDTFPSIRFLKEKLETHEASSNGQAVTVSPVVQHHAAMRPRGGQAVFRGEAVPVQPPEWKLSLRLCSEYGQL